MNKDAIKANLDAAARYRALGNYKDSRIALEQAQALGADVGASLRMTREAEAGKPTQHESMRSAHVQIMDGINTFLEMQAGPNPISKAELRNLIARNPAVWGKFAAYAK